MKHTVPPLKGWQASRGNRKITGIRMGVLMGKEKGLDSVMGRQGKPLKKVMSKQA